MQLAHAAIAATDAVRSGTARARFAQPDPAINVVTAPGMDELEKQAAAKHKRSQFDGWDMISGRVQPKLGGGPQYLDIVGVNYYAHNQWVSVDAIESTDPRYRPLHEILGEIHARYSRPLFIAETGIEDQRRVEWLNYICDEPIMAIEQGVPVEGVCFIPLWIIPAGRTTVVAVLGCGVTLMARVIVRFTRHWRGN